jgi:hypothetical protein
MCRLELAVSGANWKEIREGNDIEAVLLYVEDHGYRRDRATALCYHHWRGKL